MDEKLEKQEKIVCLKMKDNYEKCMKEKNRQFNLCFPIFTSMLYCGIKDPKY